MSLVPYYQDSAVTIFHSDCRLILPSLGKFDLLLTDPPYGIGVDTTRTNGWKAKSEKWKGARLTNDYGVNEWDNQPAEEWSMLLARHLCRWQVIFGGNFYDLPPASCWLVWDKDNGENTFADCELAWTNLEKAVRRFRYLWNGFQKSKPEERFHPTQKPLDVMAWALRQAPEDVATVLDPWMGVGTTLRAAKDAGRAAVGIELDERYCEIAARRMAQEVLALT